MLPPGRQASRAPWLRCWVAFPAGKATQQRSQGAREACRPGGSMRAYPVKSLYEEMAFIAHHFHWSHEEIMRLDHRERRRWCREISAINRALDGAPANPFEVWSQN